MELSFNPELTHSKSVNKTLGVTVFVILMSLGAFVRIPLAFSPVPITLQTFFVLLSGACLGSSLAAASQLAYIILGVAGLPIFSTAASGLLYLSGPTAGYIWGFILAALFVARFVRRASGVLSILAVFCLGDLILLACGMFWLKAMSGLSLNQAFFMGFLPFIPGDLFKALTAALAYSKIGKRCQDIFA